MASRNNIRSRRAGRRISDRKSFVLKSANDASRNAKRSSSALDLEFKIIKDGAIYKVRAGKMEKINAIPKIKVEKSGLTKGSKICLK